MKTKKCTKCEEFKTIDNFGVSKLGLYGIRSVCKVCVNSKRTKIREKEKLHKLGLKRCGKCKSIKKYKDFSNSKNLNGGKSNTCKECRKKYCSLNKKDISRRAKMRYNINKEDILARGKVYNFKNKDKIKIRDKKYSKRRNYLRRLRYKKDKMYRLMVIYHISVKNSLSIIGCKRKDNYNKILGCKDLDFENYLNSNPYGFMWGDERLELDHIKPKSLAASEEDVLKLYHHSNFQLLPSFYNKHIKSNKKWDRKHFENWLKENPI